MILGLLKVIGTSLTPEVREGDFVLVSDIPFRLRAIRTGEVIVFRHPVYGTMIKKVQRLDAAGQIYVIGMNPESVDSREFGAISRSQVLGKVIWHIRAPAHGNG
ncbi:MAG: S24/S26 family peptidase [Anaerolineales bacterium]